MRLYADDEGAIASIADRTGMEQLEVTRRAVHLGLTILSEQLNTKSTHAITNPKGKVQ